MGFARFPFGQEGFGGRTADTATTDDGITRPQYTITVEGRPLPFWLSAVWEQEIGRPGRLQFRYPLDKAESSWFGWPDDVYLYDQDGDLIDRFVIMRVTKRRNTTAGAYYDVECEGLMAQLVYENIAEYESGTSTVKDIVAGLLAEQSNSKLTTVKPGKIDKSIGDSVYQLRIERENVLAALEKLRGVFGGFMTVDTNRRLNWYKELRPSHSQEVRTGINLAALEVMQDYRNLYTAVTVYGAGNLVSKTETASTTGTYGTITKYVHMPELYTQEACDAAAAELVESIGYPQKVVRCRALDLSMALNRADLDYSHTALAIGNRVRITDTVLDETVRRTIIKIRRDLHSPVAVTIEVSNPATATDDASRDIPEADIIDVIADLLRGDQEFKRMNWLPLALGVDPVTGDVAAGSVMPGAGENIQTTGFTLSTGSGEDYARDNHVHTVQIKNGGSEPVYTPSGTFDYLYLQTGASPVLWFYYTTGWHKLSELET